MNIKPSQTDYFIQIARLAATQSTCVRLQVGAVLVREGRVISTGWNGVPPGERHCNSLSWVALTRDDGRDSSMIFADGTLLHDDEAHHEWSKRNEIHAEANCIASAARFGVKTEGASMVVTTEPCVTCALLLIAAGVSEVVYDKPYDRSEGEGTMKLKSNGVQVVYAGEEKRNETV